MIDEWLYAVSIGDELTDNVRDCVASCVHGRYPDTRTQRQNGVDFIDHFVASDKRLHS